MSRVANVCSCLDGSPKTGVNCTKHEAAMCENCDPGFIINAGQTECLRVRYVIQHPSKQCTNDTMLGTLDVCERAKAALDPRASGGVTEEDYDKAPNG